MAEKTNLADLVSQIDEAAVTPAVQPLVDSMKDLAKAVQGLADKGDDKEEDEDKDEGASDPDTNEEDKEKLDEHEDKMKDEDDEDMEKGVLALDVTEFLERLVKSVQGLPEIVAKLCADNAELRKAVRTQIEHTAALTKAVVDLGTSRVPAAAPAPTPGASGERFAPPVVLTAAPDHTKLVKAVRNGVISAALFDRFKSTGRLLADDDANAALLNQINAL